MISGLATHATTNVWCTRSHPLLALKLGLPVRLYISFSKSLASRSYDSVSCLLTDLRHRNMGQWKFLPCCIKTAYVFLSKAAGAKEKHASCLQNCSCKDNSTCITWLCPIRLENIHDVKYLYWKPCGQQSCSRCDLTIPVKAESHNWFRSFNAIHTLLVETCQTPSEQLWKGGKHSIKCQTK